MEEEKNIIRGKIKNRRIVSNEDVYDITVEDNHNFFANGILVHNCGEIILRDAGLCNLTEVVIRPDDNLETLLEKVEVAAFLGTVQTLFTNFRYLRNIWKKNAEEERLLGVSLTGIMDNKLTNTPDENLKNILTEMKEKTVEVNKKYAEMFGINKSAAITTVKPSGCQTIDGEIKTTNGILSLKDIFDISGIETPENIAENTFIDVQHLDLPKVYDEYNDEQIITKLYCNGKHEVYEIEFEDGLKYKFTAEHKLKTNNGWKRVDELTTEDNIISF